MENVNAVDRIGQVLLNQSLPLKQRFRALFTLRNIGGEDAIRNILNCFGDSSELLKHELGYCLGQMQDVRAIPFLMEILEDDKQEIIVRHEAGEALGAIGSKEAIAVLQKNLENSNQEIAETCDLALKKISWLHAEDGETLPSNPYKSVDPAPPSGETCTAKLKATLLCEDLSLFERYRAMFTLRNRGDRESVLALCEGLRCPKSALFRHEIAYVLGQMQREESVSSLSENLRNTLENPMVRHECAEALGAIATEECRGILGQFLTDEHRVVRESCEVALDMCDYETSGDFQYANLLTKN